jgi:hypothetical protein
MRAHPSAPKGLLEHDLFEGIPEEARG